VSERGAAADSEHQATSTTDRQQTPALAVEGIKKTFGSGPDRVVAVDGVSFSVAQGSVVGLLGPNGAGKTTLIKSILGMVLPDEGSVRIAGIDARASPRAAYKHVDAMLEGARNDYWRLTVRENLRYFATIGGVDPDGVADRHDRLLDRLDLAEKADTPVRDLSRGMKQKVSLASVLAGGADVVFLDEPTLGLDVESSRTLQTELRRLAHEEGLTVLLSSHDMDVVETVCDRVIVMSEGRIVADDTVDALRRTDEDHRVRLTSTDLDTALCASLGREFDVTVLEAYGTDRRERGDTRHNGGERKSGAGARIEARVDSDALYALMARLRREGVTIDRIETVEPALEDVFVDLTTETASETATETAGDPKAETEDEP
jgi:ABC-2 type transport system ATP-binding protein